MPEQSKYPRLSRVLHWLLAAAIIAMFALGLYMTSRENYTPFVISLYGWHKSVGFLVLVAVALRLSWRLAFVRLPEAPAPRWQRRAARVTHYALYALMLSVPLFGWAMSSAKGFPVSVFGWFMLPDIAPANKELGHLFHELHEYAAFTLIGLSGIHIVAALYHQFVLKDGLLRRMWLIPAGFLILPASALAADGGADGGSNWVMDKENSHIKFTATMNGAPSRGEFTAFNADFSFDEQALKTAPTKASPDITLTVNLANLSTAYDAVAPELQKQTWFHTEKYPEATYVVTGIEAGDSPADFILKGNLTLKGTTNTVSAPVTFKQENDRTTLTGNTTVSRLAFGIGEGPWESTGTVKDDIDVDYRFTLHRADME